jgi:2-methylisocitrate lyase-like PEP mutase family enzyme
MTTRPALRRLIAQVAYTMVPGAYDTLMALLVELAGFAPPSRHAMAGSSPRGPALPSRAARRVVAFAM